jgi:Fe-S cluster assembly protein SufD
MTATTQAPATAPGSSAHTDGAWAVIPIQTRSERPRSYSPEDFDQPTGREVNWKHTPIDRANSLFDTESAWGEASAVITAPDSVVVSSKAVGEAPRGEAFEPEDRASALAWSHSTAATHVLIPESTEVDEPVLIEITEAAGATHQHLIIESAAHSKATVLIRHSGTVQLTQNVEIIVRDGAHLDVVSVQQWTDDAVHFSAHQARVDRDATLRHIVVSFGGGVVRINPSVELAGTGSRGELYGLSYADSGQHLESQVFLHHKGAETSGDVLYKGALQGEGARSVWIGDVLIGPDATGTDSYEANRNLVLTEGARADSIPNLEIQTGNIRGAGHASATGRFDDEQLFYLQARGISEDEARRLVVLGFLTEIVQKINIPSLETELISAIEDELAQETAR